MRNCKGKKGILRRDLGREAKVERAIGRFGSLVD